MCLNVYYLCVQITSEREVHAFVIPEALIVLYCIALYYLCMQMTSERELHSLAIPEAFCEDSGNYMVKATNLAGQAKCYAALVVKPRGGTTEIKTKLESMQQTVTEKTVVTGHPPEFKQLFKDMKASPGSRCQFEVVISGRPRPKVGTPAG